MDHGAAIQSIRVPGCAGLVDAVLGYEDPESYRSDPYFLGATVGRYANRIRAGAFELNGQRIVLNNDDDPPSHVLHGGPGGLSSRTWRARQEADADAAVFDYRSSDGEEGFPGALDVSVRYSIKRTALVIELSAVSDADTVVSLTNHAYFNLAGGGSIAGHIVTINADAFTPVDEQGIPTGDILSVADSAFDQRNESTLSERIGDDLPGYDHNFVLNKDGDRVYRLNERAVEFAASAYCRATDLRLNVYTTQPGLQFYTGQFLGKPFVPFQGLCFEAQSFPDAPNQPGFPSTVLVAGDVYHEIIVYEFEAGPGSDKSLELHQ